MSTRSAKSDVRSDSNVSPDRVGLQNLRVPPHSVDFEQALIACCVLEGGQESIALCLQNKVRPESFYLPAHRTICRAIFDLYEDGTPLNEIILSDKLESRHQLESVGGIAYINKICDRIDTPGHIVHYIRRVRDLELVRRIIQSSMQNIERAYQDNENLDEFIEQAENSIFAISEDRLSDGATHVKKSIDSAVNIVQLMLQKRGAITGVASGFTDLDKMTFGFHDGEMIVIAARPSIGKTSLALNISENVVLPGKSREQVGVLFFSLEMSSEQLAMRLLCSRAKINMTKLRDGFISKEASSELNRVANELKNAKLWIDESSSMSILEIRAKARRMKSKENIGLIIIDYLQLIGGDSRAPREQQISEISRGIKSMAKELRVPVIVLSQLNRESEKERRQPRLSDLRESGSIEQDADVVMLLSKQKTADDSGVEQSIDGNIFKRELIIAKQRNGPVGVVALSFIKNLTRFENFSESI